MAYGFFCKLPFLAVPFIGVALLPKASAVADGQATFAARYFVAVDAGAASRNLVVSPFSLKENLSVLALGARGQTRKELLSLFGAANAAGFATKQRALRQSLTSIAFRQFGTFVTSANSIWLDDHLEPNKKFVDDAQRSAAAMAFKVPFARDAAASTKLINTWVERYTRNRIRNLLSQDTVNSKTGAILVNALSFQSRWGETLTLVKDNLAFVTTSGRRVSAPAMAGTGTVNRRPTGTVVTMSLIGGYFLRVELPDGKGTEGLHQAVDDLSKIGSTLDGELQCINNPVVLPKWSASRDVCNLASALEGMGVRSLFTTRSDVTGISPELGKITAIVQATRVSVDEEGVTSAAATATMAQIMEELHPATNCPKLVEIDRPFAYVIQHRGTGEILFVGRVDDPM